METRVIMFQSLSRDSGRLNETATYPAPEPRSKFQSLSRDSGRLNADSGYQVILLFDVSIPQSGFGAFEPSSQSGGRGCPTGFNPSVGIRGV